MRRWPTKARIAEKERIARERREQQTTAAEQSRESNSSTSSAEFVQLYVPSTREEHSQSTPEGLSNKTNADALALALYTASQKYTNSTAEPGSVRTTDHQANQAGFATRALQFDNHIALASDTFNMKAESVRVPSPPPSIVTIPGVALLHLGRLSSDDTSTNNELESSDTSSDSCPDQEPTKPMETAPELAKAKDNHSKPPCRFYIIDGSCKHGSRCRFPHERPEAQGESEKKSKADKENNNKHENEKPPGKLSLAQRVGG